MTVLKRRKFSKKQGTHGLRSEEMHNVHFCAWDNGTMGIRYTARARCPLPAGLVAQDCARTAYGDWTVGPFGGFKKRVLGGGVGFSPEFQNFSRHFVSVRRDARVK
jgi:hypothetical protein